MPIGPSQADTDRQTISVGEHGSFLPRFVAIGRVRAGVVANGGCFHTAPINAGVSQVEADDLIEILQSELFQGEEHVGSDPLVTSCSQCCCRDSAIGVFGVLPAKDETGDEFVEDDTIGHAWSVAAQRVVIGGCR